MTKADEERFIKLTLAFVELNASFAALTCRVNDLEVKLDNLRVQYDHHDHPYKPEPRYGGIFGG